MKKITGLGIIFTLAFVTVLAVAPIPASAKEGNGQGFREKIESRFQKFKSKFFNFGHKQENDEQDGDRNDDRGNDRDDDCVPPGIQHAPGIEKRVENGKGLPPGIAKKIGDGKNCNATTTPREHATSTLRITEISTTKATSTASISWKTNIATIGEIRISTSTPVGTTTAQADGTTGTSHTINLSNLAPNTIYYFVVVARDTGGNVKESAVRQFKTNALAQTDTTAPTIVYSTKADVLATSTRLIWITDELTTGKVWISTSTPVDISATSTASDSSLSYFHNIVVGNLATSTPYYYTIMASDTSSNSTNLTGGTFTTLAQ